MTQEHERLLRAMLDARRTADAASAEARRTWQAYLDAQAAFTGRFASTDYPLGPFIVGTVLIEHEEIAETWPPKRNVFNYRDVIRCPTSD